MSIAAVSRRKVFGRNLREERKRQQLSQEQLSESTNLDRTEVSRLERGKRDPRLSTIEKLAIGLGIPAGRLLDGIPPLDTSSHEVSCDPTTRAADSAA